MFIPPMPPRDTRPAGDRGFVSLRDHLAAAALTGLARSITENSVYHTDIIAEQAYALADAMLRAREDSGRTSTRERRTIRERRIVALSTAKTVV